MARALAVVIWLITLFGVALFSGRFGWFPETISEFGPAIDAQFMRTLVVVGVAFVLSQVGLGYYVWRYRGTRSGEAVYTHGSTTVEIMMMALTTVVFVTLAAMGQRVWAQLHLTQAPSDAIQIEVTGQQFVWNIRYPGADGRFGRTDPKLMNDQTNPVGVDDEGRRFPRRCRQRQSYGDSSEPPDPSYPAIQRCDPQLLCPSSAFQTRYGAWPGDSNSLQSSQDWRVRNCLRRIVRPWSS